MVSELKKIWEWTGEDRVECREAVRNEPGSGYVEVRIKAIGICGTDLHIMSGHLQFGSPPLSLGHELAGVVERVGEEVTRCQPGDRVCIDPLIGCGVCVECAAGRKHRCALGVEIGLHLPGGWQQYFNVPEANLYPIPDSLSFAEATQAETLHCCLGGIDKLKIRLGMQAAVIGDGPTGLYYIQLLKASGVARLTLIGKREERLKLGKDLGADETFFARDEGVRSMEETCEIVIDAAGTESSIQEAIRLLKKGGQLLLFGLPAQPVLIDLQSVVLKELQLIGTVNAPDVWYRVVDLAASGGVRIKPLITHTFPFERLDQAILLAQSRSDEAIKIVVTA